MTIKRKDCIDGFIGSMQKDGSNTFSQWVRANQIQAVSEFYVHIGCSISIFLGKKK